MIADDQNVDAELLLPRSAVPRRVPIRMKGLQEVGDDVLEALGRQFVKRQTASERTGRGSHPRGRSRSIVACVEEQLIVELQRLSDGSQHRSTRPRLAALPCADRLLAHAHAGSQVSLLHAEAFAGLADDESQLFEHKVYCTHSVRVWQYLHAATA
ncbi:MAG: hypothetical protein M3O32_01620 [Actinomycetota bacterium]|nr:hypothetical protein [Actinomycetota bacterium]